MGPKQSIPVLQEKEMESRGNSMKGMIDIICKSCRARVGFLYNTEKLKPVKCYKCKKEAISEEELRDLLSMLTQHRNKDEETGQASA